MSEKLRVAGIENDSITDGPGLRLTIFLQGCDKNCLGCHNPQAIPMQGGTLYTPEELMGKVRQNPLLAGVTFSGGEPLLQGKGLLPLAQMIKQDSLNLAVYTGYTFEELLAQDDRHIMELLSLTDTLIDGPFVIEQKSLALPLRGSANQRILNMQESLRYNKPIEETNPLWVGDAF